jgi:hypothetical protein
MPYGPHPISPSVWACVALLSSLAPSLAFAQSEAARRWQATTPQFQTPSAWTLFAYDRIQGLTLALDDRGQLWSHDGHIWRVIDRAGPARAGFLGRRVVVDEARGTIVVLGDGSGSPGQDTITTVHEFGPDGWVERSSVTSPGPNQSPRITYDGFRQAVVVCGGFHRWGSSNSQFYRIPGASAWDGARWQWLGGRAEHVPFACAYDPRTATILEAGAISEFGTERDTWVLDPSGAWTALREATFDGSPYLMYDDSNRGVMAMLGTSESLPHRWTWNGQGWDSAPLTNTGANPGTEVFDHQHGRLVGFGFRTRLATGRDLFRGASWQLVDRRWELREPLAPLPRYGASMTFDSIRGESLLFGGWTGTRQDVIPDAGLHVWNGERWVTRAAAGPQPRESAALAFDASRGVALLFGGVTLDTSRDLGDTWEWDGTAWSRRDVPGPAARYFPAMAHDAARGRTVLFGGSRNFVAAGDTWEWDGHAWTPRAIPGPPARFGHAMVFDSRRNVILLFGGATALFDTAHALGDTWEYDGHAWSLRSTTGPSPRQGHSMVFDSVRGVTVLFSGWTPDLKTDTWEWNGETWRERTDLVTPEPAAFMASAFDPVRDTIIAFGGTTTLFGTPRDDTWLFASDDREPVIESHPASGTVCRNATVTVSVNVEAGFPVRYQWRRGFYRRAIDGETGPTLLIRGASGSDDYDCVVTSATPGRFTKRVISRPATVTVCVADFNCDASVGPDDLVAYLREFESVGGPLADINADGFVDFFDLDDFLESYEQGCGT